MVLSYSAIAQPAADTPKTISIATPAPEVPAAEVASPVSPSISTRPAPLPSQPISGPSSDPEAGPSRPTISHLILDAGPLLSLTPLRHLATTFHTTPLVLAELRDPKAREHWERLSLSGVDVRVEQPKTEAMAKVVAFAKKTGDYAVLSQTDLSVVALTYQYEEEVNGETWIRTEPGQKLPPRLRKEETGSGGGDTHGAGAEAGIAVDEDEEDNDGGVEGANDGEPAHDVEEIRQTIEQVLLDSVSSTPASQGQQPPPPASNEPAVDFTGITPRQPRPTAAESPAPTEDPETDSDGGEWITPSNLPQHRSRDLGLVASGPKSAPQAHLAAACMTGDFAVQNVLLGMGLGLVGEGGKRIGNVKSWVLRCHGCFKLCKDSSKRFCPSCGNPTLLRTTVTTSSDGKQRVHLKRNFQYHLRGTKYSIPDPKMGRAKGQQKGGSGLILREDQMEWQDAVRRREGERKKEEKRAAKGVLGGWDDPDWLPEIITVGMSGKGRQGGQGMPSIGHGRKNPNQSSRKR